MPKPKHSPPAEEVALARVNRLLAEYAKQLRGWTEALDAAVHDARCSLRIRPYWRSDLGRTGADGAPV